MHRTEEAAEVGGAGIAAGWGVRAGGIVRALGMKDSVKVDTRFEMPQEGDTVLLCTDGLAGPCTDQEIFDIVESTSDLSLATQSLIHAANERGGPDNVTCVLARWIV